MSLSRWSRLAVALAAVAAVVAAASSDDDDSSESVPSLSEMDAYDVVGIIFMAFGLAVSSAGGVGGGVIMVPAMVLIMSFDIKRATPISNMAILGGAVANAWFNLRKRHPKVDRPLVDSDLSLAMIPVVIGGAVIGAVLSKLLPSYLISLLFVVVLISTGTRTLQKGIKLNKKETAARKAAAEQQQSAAEAPAAPATPAATYTEVLTPTVENASATAKESGFEESKEETLAKILDKERSLAWNKQGVIFVCYLGIVAVSIIDKLVDCGGVAYWVLLLIEIPWVAAFAVATSMYLLKDFLRKEAVSYPFADGDVRWNKKTVIWFPLGCAGAGVIAGLFGVGGAIITGPMIIEIGVVPEVASATSALMVLYSSAAATAKFAVFDMIAWDWAALLCALAFVVTSASQVIILGYVRRTGRQSIIVLCIGISIVIGAALMTYQAIKATIEDSGEAFSVDVCS